MITLYTPSLVFCVKLCLFWKSWVFTHFSGPVDVCLCNKNLLFKSIENLHNFSLRECHKICTTCVVWLTSLRVPTPADLNTASKLTVGRLCPLNIKRWSPPSLWSDDKFGFLSNGQRVRQFVKFLLFSIKIQHPTWRSVFKCLSMIWINKQALCPSMHASLHSTC